MWPRPHRRWDRVTAVLAERLADEATNAAPAPETLARRQAGPYDRWGRAYRWEASLAPGGAGLQVVATRTDGELHVWHIGNQGSHMFGEFELTLPAKATQERLVWLVASAAGINQSRTHHSPKSCSPATVSRVALLPTPTAARSRCRNDIGKVGIPDAVLLKPDKLTDAEFDIMKEHCVLGEKVLTMAAERLGFQSFLEIAIQITGGHHERWDGSGYPRQIAEGRIPVSARIMALADAYDAMRSERVYKPALPHEQVIGNILLQRGRQFDPDVVDSFVAIEHEFHRLSVEMADPLEQDLELLQTA